MDEHFKKRISELNRWAASVGARLICESPWEAEDLALFPDIIQPFFGDFSFSIPPSYRDFLSICGSLKLEVNWGDPVDPDWSPLTNLCWIYNPDETINARGWVLIPEKISQGGRQLTTNHLLGFAVANDISNTHWCFITDEPANENGELSIVLHNTDDLNAARFVDDGTYCYPDLKIQHKSFKNWFDAYVDELLQIEKAKFETMY